ncbi:MAG TPA: phosphopantetheine-binding protein [Noviherbaspirillum sp.]|nr:phosphopantetheine-binding protein [Noviherbaspirillum sp.]
MKTAQEAVGYAVNFLFSPSEKLLKTDPTMAELGADSLDMIELAMHVEDELGIIIVDQDIPTNLELRVSQYAEQIEKLIPAKNKVPA